MHNKNLWFVSLGCSKNLVDSEEMLQSLANSGWQLADDPSEALAIVINTCGFIDSAKTEAIDTILEMAGYKSGGHCRALAVTGCLAQRYHKDLQSDMPEIDILLGVADYRRIAEILDGFLGNSVRCAYHGALPRTYEGSARMLTTPSHWAYVKIADGCENACSYCAIPMIRGAYRSRAIEDIVSEVRHLASQGVTELNIVAQDTTRYGIDLYGKPQIKALLERICAVEGIHWVRLLYAYPEVVTGELLDFMEREPKMCKYLDIPIQHCQDRLLAAMNRRTTKAQLIGLLQDVRRRRTPFVLRTSVIAGFPGETEEEHQALVDFLKTYPFDRLGAFAYSQEEGTRAAAMPGQISEEVKQKRAERTMLAQQQISLELGQRRVGSEIDCVIDGYDSARGYILCRSQYEAPEVDGLVLVEGTEDMVAPGAICRVRIKKTLEYDLVGELI